MSPRIGVALGILAFALLCGCAGYRGHVQGVTFTSHDGIQLAGTLVLPERTPSPVPGVVVLHGAEPATRSFAYRMHANVFLERGMAVLLYDKRGAGESGGDHEAATFADLIEDALAAIRFLRDQPQVDPSRVGLNGASQSGWFTPEIAERAGNIAFVINKVGPCSSFADTVDWEIYNEILDEGANEESARQQVDVIRRIWAYSMAPTPEEKQALDDVLRAWAGRKDSSLPETLKPVSPAFVDRLRYDPTPYLERATTPMLYVYGSEDVNIPTADCVKRLTQLRRAGRPISFHVFEGAGHELGGVGITGYRFVQGYEELLGAFADEHVGRKPKQGF